MLKRIIKTSFFSLGSRGFLTLTNLIILYAVSHQLGEEKLGIYSITAFFYYLFSFFTSFELTTYLGKEIAHRRDRIGELKRLFGEIGTTFILGLGISVLVWFFLFLFYHQINQQVLLISVISGIVFGLEKNLSGILLGKEKMQFEFIAQAVAFGIVAVPVFFYARILDIAGIYLLRMGASLITIALRTYFTRFLRYFNKDAVSFSLYNWKEISFFSASGFAYFVQHHLDLFILSFLISKQQEGAYFLALRIYLSFCLLAEMTSFALTPYISRMYRNKENGGANPGASPGTNPETNNEELFQSFFRKILLTGVLLGAAASVTLFLTRDLLVNFFSKENPELSSDLLFYFSFFLFFRFVSYYLGTVLTSTRYQNIRFYILITSAALMISLEFVLGILFSIKGIICTRAIVEMFIFSAYLIALAKIPDKNINYGIIKQ